MHDDTAAPPGVVHRYVKAWQSGDLDTLIDCYSPDIVAHYGGQSRFAGTHAGRHRFLEVLAETSAMSQRELVSVDQVHDDGAAGALFATERIVSLDRTVLVLRALRYRIEDDRIVECWLYDLDQHLVDAAWSG